MELFHKIGFFLKDHAPEILVGTGVIASAGAVVTAIAATPKAIEAKKQMSNELDIIHTANEEGKTATGEEYTEEDYKKDLIGGYAQGIGRCVRPYITTILLIIASIACTLGGFGILKKRHATTLAILSSTLSQFDAYRSRVKAKLGADKERDIYKGYSEAIEETVKSEDGTESTVIVSAKLDPTIDCDPLLGPYALRIDSANPSFRINKGDPFYLEHWLSIMESTINGQLQMKGSLYLADVLRELDIDKGTYPTLNTDIAHQVGWIKNYKDGYVDFGCWRNDPTTGERKLEVVTDISGRYLYLDFNCSPILGLTSSVKTSAQEKLDACRNYPILEK